MEWNLIDLKTIGETKGTWSGIKGGRQLQIHRGYYMAGRRYEFHFRVVSIFYKRVQKLSKILFLTRENKIHIFKPPCNFFLLYRETCQSPFFTDCLDKLS